MLCELKQTVPLLERELTPAEIRIGRGNPSPWVAEAGTPTFFHPVQMPKPLSDLRFRPQRLENRVIRLGCQTHLY